MRPSKPCQSSRQRYSPLQRPQVLRPSRQAQFEMHITALNAPLRTAALCTRISSGPLAPFAYSTSSSFQQSCRSVSTKQKHQAGTISKCQNNFSFQNIHQQDVLKSSRSQHVPSITKVMIRSNSTTSTDSTKSSSYTQGAPLDWNTFFKLRTSRRRYSLGSSIIASMASTAIGVQILSGQDLENLGAQVMGLDPFIVLGLATAACGAAGWLAGPFLGNAVWGLVHRRYKSGVAVVSSPFFVSSHPYKKGTELTTTSERKGILQQNQAPPRRSLVQLSRQPGSGLLR